MFLKTASLILAASLPIASRAFSTSPFIVGNVAKSAGIAARINLHVCIFLCGLEYIVDVDFACMFRIISDLT